MCVCVYVCMHACVCVSMHIFMILCLCARNMCIIQGIYTRPRVCVSERESEVKAVCMCLCVCACMCVHIHIFVCVCVHAHACVYMKCMHAFFFPWLIVVEAKAVKRIDFLI